jgi:hypothetical protein
MFAIRVLLAGACEDDKGGDPVVTPAEGFSSYVHCPVPAI